MSGYIPNHNLTFKQTNSNPVVNSSEVYSPSITTQIVGGSGIPGRVLSYPQVSSTLVQNNHIQVTDLPMINLGTQQANLGSQFSSSFPQVTGTTYTHPVEQATNNLLRQTTGPVILQVVNSSSTGGQIPSNSYSGQLPPHIGYNTVTVQPSTNQMRQTEVPLIQPNEAVLSTSPRPSYSFSPSNIQISSQPTRQQIRLPEQQVMDTQQLLLRRTENQNNLINIASATYNEEPIIVQQGFSAAAAVGGSVPTGIQVVAVAGSGASSNSVRHRIVVPLGADKRQAISKEELSQVVKAELRKSGGYTPVSTVPVVIEQPLLTVQAAIEKPISIVPIAIEKPILGISEQKVSRRPANVSSLIAEKIAITEAASKVNGQLTKGAGEINSIVATKGYKIGDGLVLGKGTSALQNSDERINNLDAYDSGPTIQIVEEVIDEPMIYSHRGNGQPEVQAFANGSHTERRGFGNRGPANRQSLYEPRPIVNNQQVRQSFDIYARRGGMLLI